MGADAYVRAPVAREEAAGAVAGVLGGAEGVEEACTRHSMAESRRRLRVLVAEDNPLNQKVARLQLRKLGIEADCVANGREAVNAVARLPYDAVFMDCQMPNLDGYEATRRIRELPWGRSVTIIALTGWGQEADRTKTREAGFDFHLVKPVDFVQLERLLSELKQDGEGTLSRCNGDDPAPE